MAYIQETDYENCPAIPTCTSAFCFRATLRLPRHQAPADAAFSASAQGGKRIATCNRPGWQHRSLGVTLFVACVCTALSACAMNRAAPDAGQTISIDNHRYVISELTASTWTATTFGTATPIALTARHTLVAAIEKASGCKVTDTGLSRQGLQLDAQVECGSRMKN